MAEGTTAIDTALSTEGDADGTDLITYGVGAGDHSAEGALQYIDRHEEIAARKLAPPFWGKPNIAALLSAFMREIQLLEDTIWEFLELRTLPLADLARLKVLGKIVGQPRLNFDVEAYRVLIRARALANLSRGRASDLLAVLELLIGPSEYTLLAIGNATLYLSVLEPVTAQGLDMAVQILPDTRAAGVGLQLLFSPEAFEDVFVWGDAWGAPEQWGTVRIL
jgi:hypothetical protein